MGDRALSHLDDPLVHVSSVEENGIKVREGGEKGPVSGDITVRYWAVIGEERRLTETKSEHNHLPVLTTLESFEVSREDSLLVIWRNCTRRED